MNERPCWVSDSYCVMIVGKSVEETRQNDDCNNKVVIITATTL